MKTLDVSSADFLDMAESPSYNRLSFGGASVSFRVPVSRFASCPFEEGEPVKICSSARSSTWNIPLKEPPRAGTSGFTITGGT